MSITTTKWTIASLAAGVAVIASAACSSSSGASPTAPTTTTAATTTAVVTPPPPPPPVVVLTGKVQVTVTPNPVPFSGVAITDSPGCAGSPNTWFYTQTLKETGGSAVTFTSRVDSFDQRVVNNVANLSVVVPANGTATVASRWCSSSKVFHTAQSTFVGTDAAGHAITVDGPVVSLATP